MSSKQFYHRILHQKCRGLHLAPRYVESRDSKTLFYPEVEGCLVLKVNWYNCSNPLWTEPWELRWVVAFISRAWIQCELFQGENSDCVKEWLGKGTADSGKMWEIIIVKSWDWLLIRMGNTGEWGGGGRLSRYRLAFIIFIVMIIEV